MKNKKYHKLNRITGTVTHTVQAVNPDGASFVVLDSKGIVIKKVTDEKDQPLTFQTWQEHAIFGVGIRIEFPALSKGQEIKIKIAYETGWIY